jgi:phosphinothricin acetyltransferase
VHTRTGFTMVGTLENVGLKFGRWLDTVLMQRPLGEGAGTIPKG